MQSFNKSSRTLIHLQLNYGSISKILYLIYLENKVFYVLYIILQNSFLHPPRDILKLSQNFLSDSTLRL